MKKHLKSIIAIVLCSIAVLWLIPTIFVETTIATITDYELVSDKDDIDTYRITYTYERNGKTIEGNYKAKYLNTRVPLKGEAVACHYHTFPPYFVFMGDPLSPVPPMVLLVIGVLVYVIDFKKILKKKEKTNVPQA